MRLAPRFPSNSASVFEDATSAIFWDKIPVPAIHLSRVSASVTIVSQACLLVRNARSRKAKNIITQCALCPETVSDALNRSRLNTLTN